MVQNMRAYFILYVFTTKCIKCMQEMTEFSCTKTKVDLNQNLGDLSLGTKIKQQEITIKNCKKFSGVAKRWDPVAQGGRCHSMPPHNYGPEKGPLQIFIDNIHNDLTNYLLPNSSHLQLFGTISLPSPLSV